MLRQLRRDRASRFKVLCPCACYDRNPKVGIGLEPVPYLVEFELHPAVQCVHRLRPVKRHLENMTVPLEKNVLEMPGGKAIGSRIFEKPTAVIQSRVPAISGSGFRLRAGCADMRLRCAALRHTNIDRAGQSPGSAPELGMLDEVGGVHHGMLNNRKSLPPGVPASNRSPLLPGGPAERDG